MDGVGRRSQTTLKDCAGESDALAALAAGLGQELVDEGRDRFVEPVLVPVEREGGGCGVTVGEETPPVDIPQVLFQTADGPGRTGTQVEHILAYFPGPLAVAMGFGKDIRVDQAQEMAEAVVVPMMGGGGQEHHVIRKGGEPLGQLVAPGLLHVVGSAGAALGIGGALVGLVHNHQVPALLPDPLAHVGLLGVVDGADDLRLPLPGVDQLVLVVGGVDDLEGLFEETVELVLPLDGEGGRGQDEDALDGLAQLHLFDVETGHNRLARAGVIGQEKAQPGLRQHALVDSFHLVGEGANTGKRDGKLAVVGIGQANAGRLHQETQQMSVHHLHAGGGLGNTVQQPLHLDSGEDRLIQRAVGATHLQLKAAAQWTNSFDLHRLAEMAGQMNTLAQQIVGRGQERVSFLRVDEGIGGIIARIEGMGLASRGFLTDGDGIEREQDKSSRKR